MKNTIIEFNLIINFTSIVDRLNPFYNQIFVSLEWDNFFIKITMKIETCNNSNERQQILV